jgi:hypothetical protein
VSSEIISIAGEQPKFSGTIVSKISCSRFGMRSADELPGLVHTDETPKLVRIHY